MVLDIKEGLVACATVCVKSVVILLYNYLVFTLTGSGGGSFKFMPGNTNLDPLILLICANLVGVVSCMAAILLRVSPSTKT